MLQLRNTMSRRKEPFHALNERTVKMFSCGPSIYRRPHIGNYRTFVWEDVLQRYLEYLGYNVLRALNFTDVEDKAIEEAANAGVTVGELTESVAARFMDEARMLRIKLPDPILRSSTTVEQSVHLIQELLRKGYAYRHGSDIFFDPLKFKGFGKLFRLDMSRWPREKRRFKRDTYPGQRWNLGDFILWHGCKGGEQVCWDTQLGLGRPSWNIQDPAIISETLGFDLDIFCGGIDNLYRHHDYNIAVMESVSGQELARFWLHGEHVLVDGKKMSKSLHNIVYLENLIEQGVSWPGIRFYLLDRQYRKRLNMSMEDVRETGERLAALRSMAGDLIGEQGVKEAAHDDGVSKLNAELKARFENAMNDDLDTRSALEGLYEGVRGLHNLWKKGRIGPDQIRETGNLLRGIDGVLQVILD